MNNTNIILHDYQKKLLAKLSSTVDARFNDLLLEGLESEHMNYHLKKLVDLELVERTENSYRLTNKGKDYSNLMDDEIEFIEKQPKTSVLLHVVNKNEKGEVEHLLSKRLRQPYMGKVGMLTGKVQFGETLEQAAKRELFEETGLEAKVFILEQVYHKLRFDKDSKCLQDNIFYTFFIKETFGKFIKKTKHQENLWVVAKDIHKYDVFDDLTLDERFEANSLSFTESNKVTFDY